MNEIDFIRNQLDTEHRHMVEVARACSAALQSNAGAQDELCIACADYFVDATSRMTSRDEAHCNVLQSILAPDDADGQRLLQELRANVASGRDALTRLKEALAGREAGSVTAHEFAASCRAFLEQFQALADQRPARLDEVLRRHYGIAEWRRTSLVDADSILKERVQFERVRAKLPPGI